MSRLVFVLLILVWAPAQAAEPADGEVLARLAASGEQTELLFWSQEDRRVGFRNMPSLGPVRLIENGDSPFPLDSAPVDLGGVSYEVEGESFRLGDYLADPAHMGLIVVRGSEILFEDYSGGNSEESVWISFSVAKSVTSMLVGAAIRDGFIKSVDEPVVNYLPRLRGSGYGQASIRNVLNMASGVRWNEDYADPASDVANAGAANGVALASYLSTLAVEAGPGEVFNYNTGETNLVGEILRAAIGNNAATYLTHKIWRPFGMEYDAWWSLDEAGGGELGGCCISATLRDYARLGLFAMGGGRLRDGTPVLPDNWMADSTRPSEGYGGYGYLWWLFGDQGYAAFGIFGQLIRIFPDDDLVIAAHGNAEAAVDTEFHAHQDAAVQAIRDYLVSSR
ncbi:MAG: serine hydrolase [Gammaproteobacteria bacterium]|nr:serine hydrolase [Gammaproteobacteria bacterium]MYG96312.1 serine hydrolase [Gammaproteobacteria bacterium]